MSAFFAERDRQLWQGDVFDAVPAVALRHPTTVVHSLPFGLSPAQTATLAPGDEARRHTLADSSNFPEGESCDAVVRVVPGAAMLLTHDCVCDKESTRYLAVAPVKRLAGLELPQQKVIVEGRNLSKFYLPCAGSPLGKALGGDGYVDFGLISSVSRSYVTVDRRLVSLSDEGRASVLAQMIAYWARIQVHASCPKCGESLTVEEPAEPGKQA